GRREKSWLDDAGRSGASVRVTSALSPEPEQAERSAETLSVARRRQRDGTGERVIQRVRRRGKKRAGARRWPARNRGARCYYGLLLEGAGRRNVANGRTVRLSSPCSA